MSKDLDTARRIADEIRKLFDAMVQHYEDALRKARGK